MEKKSMGNFIAIMRKAKGMTQRELADLLHVSDKAVSRWEREESAPDISLIPVIADLLDVTCDELLRGEKIERETKTETETKRNQRMKILLKRSRDRFTAFLAVPMILAVIGMMAALICNFVFHKATLGFFCVLGCLMGAAFSLFAIYRLFQGETDSEEFSGEEFLMHQKYIRDDALKTVYVLMVLLGICLPLLLFGQISYETMTNLSGLEGFNISSFGLDGSRIQVGLLPKTWILFGGIGGLVAAVLCCGADRIIKRGDRIKYAFLFSEEKDRQKKKLALRRGKYLLFCGVFLLVTGVAASVFYNRMPAYMSEGTTFETFEEFKEYMETPAADMAWGVVDIREQLDHYKETVYGENGEILCEYTVLNDSVVQIEYGDNNLLPITTYSAEQMREGTEKVKSMMWIWPVLGVLECAVFLTVYWKRGKKDCYISY